MEQKEIYESINNKEEIKKEQNLSIKQVNTKLKISGLTNAVSIDNPNSKTVKIVLPRIENDESEIKKSLLNSLLKNIFLNMITSISLQLLHSINLICIGYTDSTLLQINAIQLGQVYIKSFGFTFCIGSIASFEYLGRDALIRKNLEGLHQIYNQAKIFSILIFIIFMLPFCYISNYMLSFVGINEELAEEAGLYVRYSLVAMFLAIFNHINFKFLQMLNHYYLAMFINVIVLFIHLIACVCFIVAFRLGVSGAGISMIFSYSMNLIISNYFLTKYNPCENKDIFELDTESLSSSTFYYYVKMAFPSGMINFINYIIYDFTIITAAYLSKESLCANVILLNFNSIVYLIVYCFTTPLIQNLSVYSMGKDKLKCDYNIKMILIIAFCSGTIISILIFNFAYKLGYIFVKDELTVEYVGNVIIWYSIFLYFDWGKTILNSFIIGIDRNSSMDMICSLILVFIFLPLGMLMTFSFKLGYKGFWYCNYISMVLLTLICYLYYYNLKTNVEKDGYHELKKTKISKSKNNSDDDDEEYDYDE